MAMAVAFDGLRCNGAAYFTKLAAAAALQRRLHPLYTAAIYASTEREAGGGGVADAAVLRGEEEEVEEESIPVSRRSYWTKKIHLLCSAQEVDEALRLLDRLRLRGYLPDSLNLSSVIHALCAAGRSLEAHRRFLLFLASGFVPDDRTSNVLVARLLDARSPDATRRVVDRLLVAKPCFVLSQTSYNRLIDQFCSQHQLSEARGVFLDMKARGHTPDLVSYTALISGCGRAGQVDGARQLFDEMTERGFRPNVLTYSALIRGVLRSRRIEEAREMIRELWAKMAGENDDPSINHAAFANLVDALCREGFYHEVYRIAEEMPPGTSVGEAFAYGQMMDSLCRAGRHHGASRVVYIMRKRGFTPSVVSYNCIVHGLSKQGEGGCMRAYQLFKEGAEFGYSPPEPTYRSLAEGLCREKDVHKAKDVTEFMLAKEGVDKTRIYNILLNALCYAGNPSEHLNVLVSMLQNRCHPDVVTLNTVIHGFCKVGKIEEALKILTDMLRGSFCAPDTVTFATVLRGLLDAGRAEAALDILHHTMPRSSCGRPGTVAYNTVLQGLCKLRRVDEAMEIFEEMKKEAVGVDGTTHAVILEGLLGMGWTDRAKMFWEDVVWPCGVHDDFVYAAILKGLCNLGKLGEACDFLYELVDCGVAPGIVNYNILIDAACRLRLKKEAYQIVSEMKKNGLNPDAVTWRLLEKLHKSKREEAAPCTVEAPEPDRVVWESDGAAESWEKEGGVGADEGVVMDDSLNMEFCMELNGEEAEPLPHAEPREPLSRIARRVFGLL